MKKFLSAILLVSLCIACADEKKEKKTTIDKALSFSPKTIEKKLDGCLPEEGDCTFISLTFPVAENGTGAAEKINHKIEDFLVRTVDYQDDTSNENAEVLAENFIENYKEAASEFPEYELAWEATINGKIFYRSPKLISVQFNTDIFTGGAHGYRSTNYLNFDPETGKLLTIEELFTPEFQSMVEQDFREKQEIPQDGNINSTGMMFENDEFQLPANIGINEELVILHYNAYDIAPYADGTFILTYPRAEIEQYLRLNESNIESL